MTGAKEVPEILYFQCRYCGVYYVSDLETLATFCSEIVLDPVCTWACKSCDRLNFKSETVFEFKILEH